MRSVPDTLNRAVRSRRGVLTVLGAACIALGAGLARNEATAAENECPRTWRRHVASDSSVSLCLPRGFVRREAHTWTRPSRVAGAPPIDFFSVEILDWPADSASVGHWPPRLAAETGCQFDCITVDSTTTHTDEWGGMTVRTEVGLASGGVAGLRRRPVMVAGWIISGERRGFAQGWAAKAATLDTLRQVLRTVKSAP